MDTYTSVINKHEEETCNIFLVAAIFMRAPLSSHPHELPVQRSTIHTGILKYENEAIPRCNNASWHLIMPKPVTRIGQLFNIAFKVSAQQRAGAVH
jgi:hypothetical protein